MVIKPEKIKIKKIEKVEKINNKYIFYKLYTNEKPTTKYKNIINKKPSSNQKIENVLRQNLFIAEVYLPYLYFLKKNIKPDISMYIKKPTDTNIKINLLKNSYNDFK